MLRAWIFDNGFGVRVVTEDGGSANFGYLAFPGTAWDEAHTWAVAQGATVLIYDEEPPA